MKIKRGGKIKEKEIAECILKMVDIFSECVIEDVPVDEMGERLVEKFDNLSEDKKGLLLGYLTELAKEEIIKEIDKGGGIAG